MKGLIIKDPWCDYILDGYKTWEIRGSRTNVRGKIAIIKSGTKKIYGYANLIDCIGALSADVVWAESRKHLIYDAIFKHEMEMPYRNTYAWVLENPVKLKSAKSYDHPQGAIIWVNL